MEEKTIRVQIRCQKGTEYHAAFPMDPGVYEEAGVRIEASETESDGCRLGRLRLRLKNQPCRENDNLRAERPVRVWLPAGERPEKITAMYLYNEWWTRPAFPDSFREIPDLTQIAFFQYKDGFACFLPMVGSAFKAYLTGGTESELCLELTAWMGGQRELDEPLYLWAKAPALSEAVHRVFLWLARYKGLRMREQRRLPEMFHYLGWCSWDAFYQEVTEEKLRRKAEELREKHVPVRWIIIDDGWLSVQDEMLADYAPDRQKFPRGFRPLIDEIRAEGGIRWVGVWHALGGYWGGVLPDSPLARAGREYLIRTANGKLLPNPQGGEGFYRDWYRFLSREGVDFVKVDGQSAVPYYFENSLPVSEAARGMDQALESGAYYMDGAIINCMGMAMESILARPVSAVSRNSDDFMPGRQGGFAEHLLQNAYNAIYHNELYCCDWDMFWTRHEDSVKHSLLRAVSGGPVYFSDRIAETAPEVVRPLVYMDGRVLMMDRSAKPTADCVFSDPTKSGVLKLQNIAPWGGADTAGGVAAYNLTGERQTFTFGPADIQGIGEAQEYWVYDFFGQRGWLQDRDERCERTLEAGGFAWYVVLPVRGEAACLGLLEKYVGFTAVESVLERADTQTVIVRECGTIGWLARREPRQVLVNSVDVTGQVRRKGNLYQVELPEDASRAALTLVLQ